MKTGIFGGSFDPVHSGHVGIAKRAISELSLDRLLVVPAAVSPFKTEKGQDADPVYDRLALVKAAFADVPGAVVDDRELRRGGVSYAIDTVREIAGENPGAEIVFIIGEDSVEGLPKWKDYGELKKLCEFRSFPRTRESSTEIRRRLAAGDPVDDMVPAAVADLIRRARKTYRIFVVNPGSTSTKIELFENERSVAKANVFHDSTVLRSFPTINDQLDYRMETVRAWLKENGLDLRGVDAIVGRGGACHPLEGGTYEVSDRMIADIRAAVGGIYHSSMLGVQMAKELQSEYGGLLLTVDPVMVDEYQDVARITGVKGIYRRSATHALNQKATARFHAAKTGRRYEDLNLIVCHIDGGITVMAHEHGRMVDGNNGSGGEGPLTPTRMGSMALTDFIGLLESRQAKPTGLNLETFRRLCSVAGGLSSWFGTSNSDKVHALVEQGDETATLVWKAMIYQISKSIGAMAAVLRGDVDGIVLTGGLMRFDDILEGVREQCGWIAPVASYPGELEHEAMRDGALRVLRGEEKAKVYLGRTR